MMGKVMRHAVVVTGDRLREMKLHGSTAAV